MYLVQQLSWFGELGVAQERSQELEQVDQQLVEKRPTLQQSTKYMYHNGTQAWDMDNAEIH